MPKRQRDYRAEYARRQSKAREAGFRGYAQQRRARKEFSENEDMRRSWQKQNVGPVYPVPGEETEFAAWYRALWDPKESKRRDRDSARAHYFVDVVGKVQSYDDWEERYGPK